MTRLWDYVFNLAGLPTSLVSTGVNTVADPIVLHVVAMVVEIGIKSKQDFQAHTI